MKSPCAVVLVLVAGLASAQAQVDLISQQCLGCICEASTACNTTMGCVSDGRNSYCGPFLISRNFYLDAEMDKDPNFQGYGFESCVSDPFCAGAAVRRYNARYPEDCDGDGRVSSCSDVALVHKAGPSACAQPAHRSQGSEYWRRFSACLQYFPNA